MIKMTWIVKVPVLAIGVASLALLAGNGTSGLNQLASSRSWDQAFEDQLMARGIDSQSMIAPVSLELSEGALSSGRTDWSIGAGCPRGGALKGSEFSINLCQRLADGELQL